jgi:amino acid adenylation domain-containing protein
VGKAQSAERRAQSKTRHAPCAVRHALSYLELNKKANQLAHLLREKGVQPEAQDSIVGIMVDRSIEMILGILGILKAGGAYLPIEPGYPEERIDYMLADSGAKIFLTNLSEERHFNYQLSIVNCQLSRSLPRAPLHHSSFITHHSSNLAYVIYTSGSTGKPKGVVIEHRSAVNILFALFKKYPFRETDCYLLKTSIVFDVSVSELFGWFLGGGRLVILGSEDHKDPRKILKTIEYAGVTHVNFVPSGFNAFLEILGNQNVGKLSSLKYIFLAGEALSPALVNKFRQSGSDVPLENLYGPTEGTVYASGYSLSHWDGNGNIPIGKPVPNIKLYILDTAGQLQPTGVVGELSISGEGVARGYLNNPELTAEKFVPSSLLRFSASQLLSFSLYRTGDLARWLPDPAARGAYIIEFLGRMDHQVKIRGFRIEPGEIESHLLTHEKIKEAVVLAKEMHLYAYIVVENRDASSLTVSELSEYLSKQLPDYMIPSYFVPLDSLPLTPNGKVDIEALHSYETTLDTRGEYTAPESDLERQIADTWKEVLKLEQVGIHDKFFERGGNSFNIVKLNSRLNEVLGEEIEVVTLFRYPTVSSFANHLSRQKSNVSHADKEAEKRKFEKSEELLLDSIQLFDEE